MIDSKQHSYLGPRDVRPFVMLDAAGYKDLSQIGIGFDDASLRKMMEYAGMDSLQPTVTTGQISTPIQFLQNWLPGFVQIITAARKIDELLGLNTVGAWEDEEIVQGVLEVTGSALPYGDLNNLPLSSWNPSFERRTNIRFEQGMRVGSLEEARASRMNVNSAQSKREGAALALDIQRNSVGFFGYNGGANRTYGFLNDPNLPAYVTVAATGTGSSTLWANKSFLNICSDLRTGYAQLRTQSQDTIDPIKDAITLALPTDCVDRLSTISDFGISVYDWIKTNYPNTRVVSAPQLNNANGGANVFYMYAERISDNSTDDGRVWAQLVPAKFQMLGVQKLVKGYEEGYSNATAGALLKRPYAVVRYTGI